MKIALDPTPFHHDYELLEFPRVVAELGYEYLQLTPHRDFIPFFNHPRADDELVAKFRKACADAGVGIASVLPVLRWSGPDEDAREAAVRNWKRVIQITVDLGVNVINTEFSGRPERAEESERAFFRSMEELLPIIEREGLDVRIDPHPDDFVEDGLEAARIIRGVNSPNIGMVYVACHTYHMGANMTQIMRAAGDKLRLVHVADTMDHRRSHGLRYITNPPGSPARVHQHLKIGDGDIDWDEFFSGLADIGFYDRPDTVMVSSVFAEDETAHEVSLPTRNHDRLRRQVSLTMTVDRSLLSEWVQIRALGRQGMRAGQDAWKSVEVILPARLSVREAHSRIAAQIRINAGDAGDFVQQFRIAPQEPHSPGWTKWTASYLPGPPGPFPTALPTA